MAKSESWSEISAAADRDAHRGQHTQQSSEQTQSQANERRHACMHEQECTDADRVPHEQPHRSAVVPCGVLQCGVTVCSCAVHGSGPRKLGGRMARVRVHSGPSRGGWVSCEESGCAWCPAAPRCAAAWSLWLLPRWSAQRIAVSPAVSGHSSACLTQPCKRGRDPSRHDAHTRNNQTATTQHAHTGNSEPSRRPPIPLL